MTKKGYVTDCKVCHEPVMECTCLLGPTLPDPQPDPQPDNPDDDLLTCPVCGSQYDPDDGLNI
jgi:hypothetical protein